jgi:demethylmenaquinone methyltransferase/2-methoxy-6-polyprenyl-1,4-benzoquinol methylase
MTRTHADLVKRPAEVAAMFDDLAARYDLLNDVLSLGRDRVWRKAVAKAVGATVGERVLDLAAGTGTSSASFTAAGADCVACDFSLGMLREGARRLRGTAAGKTSGGETSRRETSSGELSRGEVRFVAGDALALPFADEAFDAVTISFGLRNVHDVDAALRELLRVTKRGGRLVVCEFSSPTWTPFRRLYDGYLGLMPAAVKKVSPNPDSYVYLAESIKAWPAQADLAALITATGWAGTAWLNLTGGIVALHRASRPAG